MIRKPILRRIIRPIKEGIKGGGKDKFFFFDGSSSFALFNSAWSPSSANFQIILNFKTILLTGAEQSVIDSVAGDHYIRIRTNNTTGYFYRDVANAAVITAVPALPADTDIDVSVDQDDTSGMQLVINSENRSKSNVYGPANNNPFVSVGSNAAGTDKFLNGPVRGMQLIDIDTPANTRIYPMNEGSGQIFFGYDSNGVYVPAWDITITNAGAPGGGWK